MSAGSWARAGAEASGRQAAREERRRRERAASRGRPAAMTIGYLTFRIAGGTQRPSATSGLGA